MNSGSQVQVLYGVEAIKSIYEATLNAKNADFMCTSTQYEQIIGEWYERTFAPKLFGGKVETREILVDTADNRAYALKKASRNQVRFVEARHASETDIVLWDGRAALVSYDPKQPMVLTIEDGEMAMAVSHMFEALWRKLK